MGKCPDCNCDLQPDDVPIWKDIWIPLVGTFIIGRWQKVMPDICPNCAAKLENEQFDRVHDAGYDFGYEEGYRAAKERYREWM